MNCCTIIQSTAIMHCTGLSCLYPPLKRFPVPAICNLMILSSYINEAILSVSIVLIGIILLQTNPVNCIYSINNVILYSLKQIKIPFVSLPVRYKVSFLSFFSCLLVIAELYLYPLRTTNYQLPTTNFTYLPIITSNIFTSLGEIPGILLACPIVSGSIRASFCRASVDKE